MSRPYSIWPLRFSPQPAAMIDFFAALGLHKALSHDDETFATFDGRSGKLGVHSAADTASGPVPGHTALNLATTDIAAAAAEMTAAGLAVQVWDETYGKQGVVTSPDGRVVGLNEDTQDDLYGDYQVHEQTVAASMDVVAICPTDDFGREAAFFATFGFSASSVDDPEWVALRASGVSGVLGLHRADARPGSTIRPADDQFGPPYLVRLGFQTSEPLDALAARLRDAGYPATTVEDHDGVHVQVTDPDGEEIQVYPTS